MKTHGLRSNPLYDTWHNMMRRCYNKDHHAYANYGGRGIDVCERWHSVVNFISDITERPFKGAQLDRKDNNKGYFPANCEWVTPTENGRNTRINKNILYKGRYVRLHELSKISGFPEKMINSRLARGWSPEDAVSIPKRSPNDKKPVKRCLDSQGSTK